MSVCERVCRSQASAAGVSTSGFYDWCTRRAAPPTPREVSEAELVELMREIFDASDGTYGVLSPE